MKDYTILEKLDAILNFIINERDEIGLSEYLNNNYNEAVELLEKLSKDGYIKREQKTKNDPFNSIPTTEGRVFSISGGYVGHKAANDLKEKLSNDKVIIDLKNAKRIYKTYWITFALACLGALLGIYTFVNNLLSSHQSTSLKNETVQKKSIKAIK
ncbi:hypothetical protein ACRQ5D_13840 [Mucilaginibacter sp. P25]|uniref:Uncharacterized protein n=1 Tax=Mucilaginibacter gossypii TaxID=551996 RepID=A0A1G8FPG3_9SPHI|nr:hypothetical protein [Mucilaginibacter gossypii]SDH84063.1 hypothetical protein SAMN05192573_11321 [Mucilaginibacter gossypii]